MKYVNEKIGARTRPPSLGHGLVEKISKILPRKRDKEPSIPIDPVSARALEKSLEVNSHPQRVWQPKTMSQQTVEPGH